MRRSLPATFRAAVEEVAFTGRVVLGSRNVLPEDFREVIRMLGSGAVSCGGCGADAGRVERASRKVYQDYGASLAATIRIRQSVEERLVHAGFDIGWRK